jgi:hypothetical protein
MSSSKSRWMSLAVAATLFSLAGPARAGHHSWFFTEIFSNASGTVQFIEMSCPNNGEAGLGPFSMVAGANTFNFVTNLPSASTANTWVLMGTPAFAALSGAPTPDYVLPSNFFSPAGGTLNYASGIQIWNYPAVPTNGVLALLRNGSTAVNTPKNFAGVQGQVNAGPPPAVPSFAAWGLILLVGAMLLAASGMLRRSATPA